MCYVPLKVSLRAPASFPSALPPFEEFEAENQREFAELISRCDLVSDTVQVPEVLKASREVLIQEWLPGKKLTEEGAAKEQAQEVATE